MKKAETALLLCAFFTLPIFSLTLNELGINCREQNNDQLRQRLHYALSCLENRDEQDLIRLLLARLPQAGADALAAISPESLFYDNARYLYALALRDKKQPRAAARLLMAVLRSSDDPVLIRLCLNRLPEVLIAANEAPQGLTFLARLQQGHRPGVYYPQLQTARIALYRALGKPRTAGRLMAELLPGTAQRRQLLKGLDGHFRRLLSRRELLYYYMLKGDYHNLAQGLERCRQIRRRLPLYNTLLGKLASAAAYQYQARRRYQRAIRYRPAKRESLLAYIISRYPSATYAEYAGFRLGSDYMSSQRLEKCLSLYERLLRQRWFSANRNLLCVRAGVLAYRLRRGQTALDYFRNIQSGFMGAYAAYMTGRLLAESGRAQDARDWLLTVLPAIGNSYYGFRSEELLRQLIARTGDAQWLQQVVRMAGGRGIFWFLQTVNRLWAENPGRTWLASGLRLYLALRRQGWYNAQLPAGGIARKYACFAAVNCYTLATPYLRHLAGESGHPALLRMIAQDHWRNNAYLEAVIAMRRWLAHEPVSVDHRLLPAREKRILYPLKHVRFIHNVARPRDVDPALVLAVIRQESVFAENARSAKNARGLMQITPGTGFSIARGSGVRYRSQRDLFHPHKNIFIGVTYLRRLLAANDNSVMHALAAYNAGPRHARRWQAMYSGADNDIFLYTITFKETRQYIQHVLRNRYIYREWRHEP